MATFKRLDGECFTGTCLGCDIITGKIPTFVERIAETKNFVVEQDFAYPIPGFTIIASKRHIQSITEFNAIEEAEYTSIVRATLNAMYEAEIGDRITLIQEDGASHFHLWLFPWQDWMKPACGNLGAIPGIMLRSQEMHGDTPTLLKIKNANKNIRDKFRL